nr:SigE family RNA polymerase sigma factor [Micromonospora sp. DSM 115978]
MTLHLTSGPALGAAPPWASPAQAAVPALEAVPVSEAVPAVDAAPPQAAAPALAATPGSGTDPGIGRTVAQQQPQTWAADEAVTRLFASHYRSLVRLAALLLHDRHAAEEIVQEAYVALHGRWGRLRGADKAAGYLRVTVVNRCRSALRHRQVVQAHLATTRPDPDMPSAETGALDLLQHDAILAALRDLPPRQREAVVLRYYAELSEAETAEAMKVSRGAVKSHTSRGLAALRRTLGALR